MYQLQLFVRACEPHAPDGQDVLDFALLILPRWLPKPSPWKFPKPGDKGRTKWTRLANMKRRLKKVFDRNWQPKSYVWAVNNAELSKGKRQQAEYQRVYQLQKELEETLKKNTHKKSDAKKALVPCILFLNIP